MWGRYIRDIGVVGELSGQDGDASWAADGGGAKVLLVERSTVDEMLVDQRNIVQRVHMKILVVGQNKDDIRPRRRQAPGRRQDLLSMVVRREF